MNQAVRTRFAPSPTGYMHVGGVRTALFAWLVARQAGGQFILRLEDTDQAREVSGSAEHIMESLRWLGLDWDEGVGKGGEYGPYKQSERLSTYKAWAQKLADSGKAYADPYTPDQLQSFRERAQAGKRPFLFRDHRPEQPPRWDGTQPLRLKSDPKNYTWQDAVMGELSAGPEAVDDFILMKSDGFPTYNFAHIIDDYEMHITHVIRSQEFVASVPRFLNLYEALGFEPPVLATLPFVMAPDGKKKLSKRDGAKDILEYAKEGYLPEALLNFLASLGWNDGTEQEIFSVSELIQKFNLERVQKGGAKFDEQRLVWMNGAHIRGMTVDELYDRIKEEERSGERRVRSYWPKEATDYDETYKKRVLGLVQERLKYFSELPDLSIFFFKDLPVNPQLITQHKQLGILPKNELKNLLQQSRAALEASDFKTSDLANRLNKLLETTGQKPAVLFSLIRIAITQAPASPGLAETLSVLGKDKSLARINTQLGQF